MTLFELLLASSRSRAELLGRAPLFAGECAPAATCSAYGMQGIAMTICMQPCAGGDFMETVTMQINVLGTRPADELTYIK